MPDETGNHAPRESRVGTARDHALPRLKIVVERNVVRVNTISPTVAEASGRARGPT
ncbi:hypothetical protein ACFVKB_05995 [Rhodococcus sp. NPDC127530]|uniref:hypothetical protein n=1 Tax=unclassified Rhodococcus (in: high G+C Gram-positive bacteria) TaxID=192944 RepID=UPI003627B552